MTSAQVYGRFCCIAAGYERKSGEFFYKKGVQLSAMLTGDDYFEICPYEDEDNLFGAIGYILERN